MSRTIHDWLSHASGTSDPVESERCLQEALRQAESFSDWRAILAAVASLPNVSRERLSAIANRTLELATADREVWGFRDVAAVRAVQLEDEDGARAALQAGEAIFREPRTDIHAQFAEEHLGKKQFARGYEWVLLGQGFSETLRDDAGLRRCLEAARDMARAQCKADDLCAVAEEWGKRIDRDEGGALLLEAEGMASDEPASPWTLANAWNALGEPDVAFRVLDAALREATDAAAALHVFRAWVCDGKRDDAARALTRAKELARGATEWLAVGETAFDAGVDASSIREAVEHAEAAADSPDLRGRVSSAYRVWLQDEEAAARVGPRGLPPEALRVRGRAIPGWESSASALFEWLRARATPEMLTRIAHADYGMDAYKHLAALQDICATGLVPRTLAWEPHEVLALTRWSKGEGVDHVERALCCVILCLAPSDMDELVTNGVILAESCLALGPEAIDRAQLFFAWQAETVAWSAQADDVSSEQPIALLILFILRAATTPADARLEPLSRMLVEHPRCEAGDVADWIVGSLCAQQWGELFDRILMPLRDSHAHIARVLAAVRR